MDAGRDIVHPAPVASAGACEVRLVVNREVRLFFFTKIGASARTGEIGASGLTALIRTGRSKFNRVELFQKKLAGMPLGCSLPSSFPGRCGRVSAHIHHSQPHAPSDLLRYGQCNTPLSVPLD
jgi:hypothetical protein